MAINEKYKKELILVIQRYLPESTIYLFGSRAKNTEKMGSDVDLAVDSKKTIHHESIIQILIDIEDTIIPFKIDLINLQTASNVIKQEILKHGVLWKR
jgi:uncharacterized protein